ncbi:MAG: hypothetical protein J0I08_23365 [Rhizobiales bacterium]|nr:hypothetical protein [Hyphomicrobiales bacterium]
MSKPQRSHDRQGSTSKFLTSNRQSASTLSFPPKNVVRCVGIAIFRTQAARDVGCLLDLDPSVISWTCLPLVLSRGNRRHVPDFAVTRATGVTLVDAIPDSGKGTPPQWASDAAQKLGYGYETHHEANLRGDVRLDNARDLLQYASFQVSLGDRLRVLTLLEEHGAMPLSACLQAVRHIRDAIGVIAALALRRFIEIELDEGRIGPDTRVSRFRG